MKRFCFSDFDLLGCGLSDEIGKRKEWQCWFATVFLHACYETTDNKEVH